MAKRKKVQQAVSEDNLNGLRTELRKKFGEDAIKVYTEAHRTPTVSTGIIALDQALGGGFAEGRMTELLGEASSGKTTIALAALANAQKKYPDKRAIYVDTEHALDTVWAEKLGVNLNKLDHVEPEFGEDAIFIMEAYLKTKEVSILVLDSAAALLPKAEADNDIGDANIGLQARLIASAMRRINKLLNKNPETMVIWINQKRARIGGGPASFAFEPTKSTGGKALPFYMTTRISVVKIKALRDNDRNEYGQVVVADVLKNKVNNGPGAKVTFQIDNAHGIDTPQELLELAQAAGKVEKSGAWYTFVGEDEKVQGENAAKDIIRTKYLEKWTDELVNG